MRTFHLKNLKTEWKMRQLMPIQLNKCEGNDNAAYAKHYVYDTYTSRAVWKHQSMQSKRDSANKQTREH